MLLRPLYSDIGTCNLRYVCIKYAEYYSVLIELNLMLLNCSHFWLEGDGVGWGGCHVLEKI